MSCCHYDEGYDEGYDAAKREGAGVTDTADVLEQFARELDARCEYEKADLARELASEVTRDGGLAERAKHHVERAVTRFAEYKRSKAA